MEWPSPDQMRVEMRVPNESRTMTPIALVGDAEYVEALVQKIAEFSDHGILYIPNREEPPVELYADGTCSRCAHNDLLAVTGNVQCCDECDCDCEEESMPEVPCIDGDDFLFNPDVYSFSVMFDTDTEKFVIKKVWARTPDHAVKVVTDSFPNARLFGLVEL